MNARCIDCGRGGVDREYKGDPALVCPGCESILLRVLDPRY